MATWSVVAWLRIYRPTTQGTAGDVSNAAFNGERTNTIKAYVRNGALPIDVGAEVMSALEADGFTVLATNPVRAVQQELA